MFLKLLRSVIPADNKNYYVQCYQQIIKIITAVIPTDNKNYYVQ